MNPEWLGLGVPLAVAAWLVWQSRATSQSKLILLFGLVGLTGGAACVWSSQAARRPASLKQLTDEVPAEGRPGGYVSSAKCESCHPAQYESWHRTFHRTMTQLASPESVLGRFDHVQLELRGKQFLLERRGSEFWAEMEDPEWRNPARQGEIA